MMWNTRIFLIAVLLVKINARPDGYGVKGGRFHKATANAVASAHATAHANAGSFGTAKSSARAIATASSNGDSASNAVATANASIDGGNIEKDETREKENGNANELGDSDDLRQSNDRAKGTEYKCINHQDGTATWNPRNPDAEHVASGADDADSRKTEESDYEPDCSPKGIKGHRGTPGGSAGSHCKDRKTGENPQFPAQNGDIDLSTDRQHSTEGNGGKGSKPGTIDRGHAASPCTPGDSKCHIPNSGILNPQPTYESHPELPDDSLKPPGVQGSYGENSEKPGSFAGGSSTSPCANGGSKCPTTVNPSYENHPNLPAGSLEPPGIDNSYGQPSGKPGIAGGSHSASPCANGSSKCPMPKPSTFNPYSSYGNHPNSPADSLKLPGIENSYAQHNGKPGINDESHSASPCAPGDSKCFIKSPSVSSPYPTSEKYPDLPIGSSKPTGSSSGYGGNTEKPGMVDRSYAGSPCGSGGSKCFMQKPTEPNTKISESPCVPGDSSCIEYKPSTSKPHSTFDEKPDSPGPIDIDGIYGGINTNPGQTNKPGSQTATPCASGDSKCVSHKPTFSGHHPGTINPTHSGHPCAAGDSKCSAHKPSVSNPYPSYEKNPDLSAGSSSPGILDGGSGGSGQEPGNIGKSGHRAPSPCAPLDWKCLSHEPTVPSLYPAHEKNPYLSAGSNRPMATGSGNNGHTPGPLGGNFPRSPCAPGDSKCSGHKPSGPNSYPSSNTNPWTPTSEDHSVIEASGSPSSGKKPGTLNPFLNGEIDVSSIKSSLNSGATPGGKINPLNPFLNPQYQPHPSTGPNYPSNSNGNNGSPIATTLQNPQAGSFGGSGYPQVTNNPFLHPHGQVNPTSGVKYPGIQTTLVNKFPNSQSQPGTNIPANSNCQGSASCKSNKPSELFPDPPEYPHGGFAPGSGHDASKPNPPKHTLGESFPESGHHEPKPNFPNPFFPQHGHEDKPKDSKHPEANNQNDRHPQTGGNKPSTPINDCYGIASCIMTLPPGGPPKNPFLTNHGLEVEAHGVSAGHKPMQYPDSHGSSTPKPETGASVPNPFLGHSKDPSNDRKPETAHGCGSGTSFGGCNPHNGPMDKNVESSVTDGFGTDTTTRRSDYGVKGHRPGVEGGSRGPPMKLQRSSGLGDSGHFGPGQNPSAQSSADASAGAFSHASASSSSTSTGGQSSASAKSEAYSTSQSADGLSSSWASSSAHASAFASSYSSSDSNHGQGGATIPEVPAQ